MIITKNTKECKFTIDTLIPEEYESIDRILIDIFIYIHIDDIDKDKNKTIKVNEYTGYNMKYTDDLDLYFTYEDDDGEEFNISMCDIGAYYQDMDYRRENEGMEIFDYINNDLFEIYKYVFNRGYDNNKLEEIKQRFQLYDEFITFEDEERIKTYKKSATK